MYQFLLLIRIACFALWMGAVAASRLVVCTLELRPTGLTGDATPDAGLLRAERRSESPGGTEGDQATGEVENGRIVITRPRHCAPVAAPLRLVAPACAPTPPHQRSTPAQTYRRMPAVDHRRKVPG